MKTETQLALGLGVGYLLGSTGRVWLGLMGRLVGAGSGRGVPRGVLRLGAMAELGKIAEPELAGGNNSVSSVGM